MTREEAIEIINRENDPNDTAVWDLFPEYREALNMAIKALLQESTENWYKKGFADGYEQGYKDGQKIDMISRKAVLSKKIYTETEEGWSGYTVNADYIEQLPSVTQKSVECDDAISRKSIKQKLQEHHDFFVNAYGGFNNLPQNDKSRVDEISNCIAMVVNEPPIKPQEPKTGHWILDETDNSITCDKCGCLIWANDISNGDAHYCPNCGHRMVEPQESRGKE